MYGDIDVPANAHVFVGNVNDQALVIIGRAKDVVAGRRDAIGWSELLPELNRLAQLHGVTLSELVGHVLGRIPRHVSGRVLGLIRPHLQPPEV